MLAKLNELRIKLEATYPTTCKEVKTASGDIYRPEYQLY